MVDTSEKAEIQTVSERPELHDGNGLVLVSTAGSDHAEKARLKELCDKTGTLLKEAQQGVKNLKRPPGASF